MGYVELREALKKARRVSETDMTIIDSEINRLKRKYCGSCRYFNHNTRVCKKNRVIRICRKRQLRNKE